MDSLFVAALRKPVHASDVWRRLDVEPPSLSADPSQPTRRRSTWWFFDDDAPTMAPAHQFGGTS